MSILLYKWLAIRPCLYSCPITLFLYFEQQLKFPLKILSTQNKYFHMQFKSKKVPSHKLSLIFSYKLFFIYLNNWKYWSFIVLLRSFRYWKFYPLILFSIFIFVKEWMWDEMNVILLKIWFNHPFDATQPIHEGGIGQLNYY